MNESQFRFKCMGFMQILNLDFWESIYMNWLDSFFNDYNYLQSV
jgi:hypothetical protein